ncbi:MAG: hypothetical protein ACE5LU_01260 [Anaerolineae bacterium]
MHVLPKPGNLSEGVYRRRGSPVTLTRLSRWIDTLAGPLILAVLVEIVLLRILARAGIYMFKAGTPVWLRWLYGGLVFLGNVGFYFAGLLVVLLLALLAYALWHQPSTLKQALAGVALAVLGLSAGLPFITPPPVWSLLYLLLSVLLVTVAAVLLWTESGSQIVGLAVLALGLSWVCAYYVKAAPLLGRLGVVFPGVPAWLLLAGEALAGLGILLAFLGFRQLSRKGGVTWGLIAAVTVLPLLVVYAIKPEMLPLIAIWAFGLGFYLPFPVYAIGLWLLILTAGRLAATGRWQACPFDKLRPVLSAAEMTSPELCRRAGAGLLLILLSHRMLPLIYFNLLIVVGFLLMSLKLDIPAGHLRALAPPSDVSSGSSSGDEKAQSTQDEFQGLLDRRTA